MKSARWGAIALAAPLAFLLAAPVQAADGNVEAGRVKANTCMGCHGIPKYNNVYPTYRVPKLGGQSAEYLAAALNACGYDADLENSAPVRKAIRDEINQSLAAAPPAACDHRDALCGYIREHRLTDPGLNLAQYISLSLYLTPQLTPTVEETQLPPDSTQVVNILPLLRTFAEDINLHAIWVTHRADYDALVQKVHDHLTKTILDTNIYLHLPISSYDGRRFLVVLEPMLAPSTTNARIYGTDYLSEPSSFLRDIDPLLIDYDEADEYGAENIIEA